MLVSCILDGFVIDVKPISVPIYPYFLYLGEETIYEIRRDIRPLEHSILSHLIVKCEEFCNKSLIGCDPMIHISNPCLTGLNNLICGLSHACASSHNCLLRLESTREKRFLATPTWR